MITLKDLDKNLFWNGDKIIKVTFVTDDTACKGTYRTWNKLINSVDKEAEVLSIKFTKKKIKMVIRYHI